MWIIHRDNIARNKHFLAPEWGSSHEAANNTAIDIYAFGVCALESLALELVPGSVHPPSSSAANSNGAKEGTGDKASSSLQQGGNGGGTNGNQVQSAAGSDTEGGIVLVTEESIQKTIDCLEDEMQKDFIRKCLRKAPEDRPTARELLFHPVLFEVHSLKLLAAHILVNTPGNSNLDCVFWDHHSQSRTRKKGTCVLKCFLFIFFFLHLDPSRGGYK